MKLCDKKLEFAKALLLLPNAAEAAKSVFDHDIRMINIAVQYWAEDEYVLKCQKEILADNPYFGIPSKVDLLKELALGGNTRERISEIQELIKFWKEWETKNAIEDEEEQYRAIYQAADSLQISKEEFSKIAFKQQSELVNVKTH